MNRRRLVIVLVLAALAFLAIAAGVTFAVISMSAKSSLVKSDGSLFFFDTNVHLAQESRSWHWDEDVYGSMSPSDVNSEIICSSSSTGAFSFLSQVGSERMPAMWQASAQLGFNGQSTHVLNPILMPGWLANGNNLAARDAGGDFSLGVACTKNDGTTVTGVFFRGISVQPGGLWIASPIR